MPGKPALGNYIFIINAGGTQVTTSDAQNVNRDIPSADVSTFSVQGNTFSWGAVSFPETPLYYRLVIDDQSGNRVYNSTRELNMLSHTVPANKLVPGQTYKWRVHVSDAADWVAEQNRSNSQYVQLTWGGSIDAFWVQHREKGDGENLNRIHFRFKDKNGQYIQNLADVSDVRLYDPSDQLVTVAPMELRYGVDGSYDETTGQWSLPGLSFEGNIYAEIAAPPIAGTYRLELTYKGDTFRKNYQSNGVVPLPVVSLSSFKVTADENGNLTWTWELPQDLCSTTAQIPNTFAAPVIDIYKQGQEVGWIFMRGPTCLGHFNLPAALVQAINNLGDEFRLHIDVRTTDNNNSAVSDPLVLPRLAGYPLSASLQGTATDAATGGPISGAALSFNPGNYQVISGADSNFFSSDIPSGTYSVSVTAPGYNSKSLANVSLSSALPNQLNVSLTPYAPQVISAAADPTECANDGQSTTRLTVRVTHPLGPASIVSVLGDLRDIGGSAQQLFDKAGDGTYSFLSTVKPGTKARLYALNVTAFDKADMAGLGSISLNVIDMVSGVVQPGQSDSKSFDNPLEGQTLQIHLDLSKAVSRLKVTKSECQIELTIVGPNDEQYGPYSVTDSIDVSIPNAAAGQWKYETSNQCASEQSYEIETSGSGTGVLVGRVTDAITGGGLQGASINCNTGGATVSLAQGYFSSVAVAGTGVVTTAKAGYQTNVKGAVYVKAGGTTNLNIQVVPQGASAQTSPSGIHVFNILDPAEDPKPPTQPFAAKVSGSNLEFNAIVPRYQQSVDVYLGLTINDAQHAGRFFLVNESDSLVELTDTLYPWRKGISQGGSAQVLKAISSAYPMGSYTLYSLVTTDSATLSNYDLSFFTTTLAQPAPVGQNVTYISSPKEDPDPFTQPLAAKITGGNLILNAHFPMEKEPVTIFLAYTTPNGALYLIKADGSRQVFTDTLWRWRENVTAEVAEQVFSIPVSQTTPGVYSFFSLVTTDPVSLSNYDLLYFSMSVPQ